MLKKKPDGFWLTGLAFNTRQLLENCCVTETTEPKHAHKP
jgi:hypothetical protein